MFALVFEYRVNINATKALISFWNHPTHTILTKVGEKSISLLDIVEITSLPIIGGVCDKRIPQ